MGNPNPTVMKLLLVALLSSAATAALVSLKLDTSSGAYSVSTEYVDFMGLDYVIQMNKTTL